MKFAPWLVTAVALLLRVWWARVAHPLEDHLHSDMQLYLELGTHLQWQYVEPWLATRPFGLPLLLKFLSSIGFAAVPAYAWVQALLGGLAAAAVYPLARNLGATRSWALVAQTIAALHLPSVHYSGFVLSETLTAVTVQAALLCAVLAYRSEEHRGVWSGLTGFLAMASAAIRSNMVLLPFLLPLVLIGLWRKDDRRLDVIRERMLAPYLIGMALAFAPLFMHAQFHSGKLVPTATNGGVNFYLNFSDVRSLNYVSDDTEEEVWLAPKRNVMKEQRPELVDVPFFDEGYFYRRGVKLLASNPGLLFRRAFENLREQTGCASTFQPFPRSRSMPGTLRGYRTSFGLLVFLPWIVSGAVVLFNRSTRARLLETAHPLVFAALPSWILAAVFFLGTLRTREPFDFVILASWAALVPLALSVVKKRSGPARSAPHTPCTPPCR